MGRMVLSTEPERAMRSRLRFTSRGLTMPLARGCRLRTYRFPGRWMDDERLQRLRNTLHEIARYRLDPLPEYGIFLPGREPFRNRIVTVAYEDERPVAFGAMVWIPMRRAAGAPDVLHLGLVVTTPNRLSPHLLWQMYYYPVFYMVLRRFPRSFWISCVSLEPSVIGAVSDHFPAVLPNYREPAPSNGVRAEIARTLVRDHAHEFGAGSEAVLDERTFVVRGSCRGPSESLRTSYRRSAKYVVRDCNDWCRDLLDYERGDELLQLGRADAFSGIRLGVRRRLLHGS